MSRPITTKIGFSGRVDTAGVLIDRDGTLAGVPGGAVAPYTGQFRDNPDCAVILDRLYERDRASARARSASRMKLSPFSLRYDRVGTPEYVACTKPVRRISLKVWDSL